MCEIKASNVLNCKASDRFKRISQLILLCNQSMLLSKTLSVNEGMLKLYSNNSLHCYRMTQYRSNETNIYLSEVIPNEDCSIFKYGVSSVIVQGLGKYLTAQ